MSLQRDGPVLESLTEEFERLAVAQGLSRASKNHKKLAKYLKAKSNFIADKFEGYFGQDTKLENWQQLCRDLGLQGNFESITKCKKVVYILRLCKRRLIKRSRL